MRAPFCVLRDADRRTPGSIRMARGSGAAVKRRSALPAPVTLRGERLTLRAWRDDDLPPFAALNADAEVMRYFPAPLSREESDALAIRIRRYIEANGFGLWALDVDGLGFCGFVGLSPPVPFDLDLPGIEPHPHEIGWRLARRAWHFGYATEAATLALDHALKVQMRGQIVSFTALENQRSQRLMARIGLTRRGEFDHPRMPPAHPLRRHVLYAVDGDSGPAQRA